MKKLTTLIILIGILVAISPIAGKLYLDYTENRLLNEWYNSEDAAAAEDLANTDANPEEDYGQLQDVFAAEAPNANQTDESAATQVASSGPETSTDNSAGTSADSKANTKQKQAEQQIVLGIIKIDKIKIKYPIVEGVKASNLKVGIGHIPGTAALGQPGNSALAGHRNYTFGRFFNRLDELQEGDIISVSTKKEEFRYKVYKKLIVLPEDVSVLKGSKDDTVLTLITCTPIYIATHRLIVQARLEERRLLEP